MKSIAAVLPILLLPLASQSTAQARAARSAGARPAVAPAVAGSVERRLTVVTQQSISRAIEEAGGYISAHKGASVVIRIPAGAHDLSGKASPNGASIDVSEIDACPGRLTISGEGAGRTTIIKDNDLTGVLGRGTSCVTIANMTLMQRRREVSQGTVVSAAAQAIVIDVPSGFPTPAQLMAVRASRDSEGRARYWLKRYVNAATGPRIVPNEKAARWTTARPVSGSPNRWRLSIARWRGTAIYHPGDLIGIKTKSGGQAYRFTDGHDIAFRGVRWINDARGKFRRVNNVTIENCLIARPPAINGVKVAVSTSGGGPQIGHRADPMTSGHLVQNNMFEATGDDAIALANASGVVRNNRINDVNRGILLVGSPNVKLENNTFIRASLVIKAADKQKDRRGAANDNDQSSD